MNRPSLSPVACRCHLQFNDCAIFQPLDDQKFRIDRLFHYPAINRLFLVFAEKRVPLMIGLAKCPKLGDTFCAFFA